LKKHSGNQKAYIYNFISSVPLIFYRYFISGCKQPLHFLGFSASNGIANSAKFSVKPKAKNSSQCYVNTSVLEKQLKWPEIS